MKETSVCLRSSNNISDPAQNTNQGLNGTLNGSKSPTEVAIADLQTEVHETPTQG